MAAPTITTKIADGSNTPITPTNVSGVLTAHVDYGSNLRRKLNLAGSVACYMYLSDVAGTKPCAEIGTTAANTEYEFDLSQPFTFYAAAKTDSTLGTDGAIGASTTDLAEVTVVMIADLNKIVRTDSYAVGLGQVKAYDLDNCTYAAGGILLVGEANAPLNAGNVLGVLSACIVTEDASGGPYLWFYDKANNKLMLFSAIGSELSSGTVKGTVILLKQ